MVSIHFSHENWTGLKLACSVKVNAPLKKCIIAVNKLGTPTAPSPPLLLALKSGSPRVREAIRICQRRTISFEDTRVSLYEGLYHSTYKAKARANYSDHDIHLAHVITCHWYVRMVGTRIIQGSNSPLTSGGKYTRVLLALHVWTQQNACVNSLTASKTLTL